MGLRGWLTGKVEERKRTSDEELGITAKPGETEEERAERQRQLDEEGVAQAHWYNQHM